MVDVEQRTLRTFKQHALALLAQLVADAGHVGFHRLDVFAKRHRFIEGLLEIHRLDAQILGQYEVESSAARKLASAADSADRQCGYRDAPPCLHTPGQSRARWCQSPCQWAAFSRA